MSIFSKVFSFESKPEQTHAKELAQVNSFKDEVAGLSQEQIKDEITKYKQELAGLDTEQVFAKLKEIRPRVFALVREAAKRSMGQFHYDVQVIGGIVLSEGRIAE